MQGPNSPPWGQSPGAAGPANAPLDGDWESRGSPPPDSHAAAPETSREGVHGVAAPNGGISPVTMPDGSLDLPTAASGPSSDGVNSARSNESPRGVYKSTSASGPSASAHGPGPTAAGPSLSASGPSASAGGPSVSGGTGASGEGAKADASQRIESSVNASGPAVPHEEGGLRSGGGDGNASPIAAPQSAMVRDVNPQTEASVINVSDAAQHAAAPSTAVEGAYAPGYAVSTHTGVEGAHPPADSSDAHTTAGGGNATAPASATGPGAAPARPPGPDVALLGAASVRDPAAVAALERAGILPTPARPPPTADRPLRGPLPLGTIVGALLPLNPPGTAPAAAIEPAVLGAALPNALGPALLPGLLPGAPPSPSVAAENMVIAHEGGRAASPTVGDEEAAACVLGRRGGGQAFVDCGEGHLGKAIQASAPGAASKEGVHTPCLRSLDPKS